LNSLSNNLKKDVLIRIAKFIIYKAKIESFRDFRAYIKIKLRNCKNYCQANIMITMVIFWIIVSAFNKTQHQIEFKFKCFKAKFNKTKNNCC